MALKRTAYVLVVFCVALNFIITSFGGGDISASEVYNDFSEIDVSARSAILYEPSSGKVIYEKNSREMLPMASTTKIMTAIVAIENSDCAKIVSVSEDAVGIEGSSIYLYPGEKLSMSDLIYALMLESANDAATAIAIEIAGSVDAFAELMNRKAKELGLENTSFSNPHGLDEEGHYTTAYDLARLAGYALQNEQFKEIVSTYKRVIPMLDGEGSRLLLNHNKLLKRYDGAIGVKTGYTKKSGRCLVSSAERDGMSLIAVTLNAPSDWEDHEKMLDLGFSMYKKIVLCEPGSERISVPCVGSADKNEVTVTNKSELSVVMRSDESDITQIVELKRFCFAPISEGEVLGKVCYYSNGVLLGESELVADFGVARIAKRGFWDFITSLFR